MLRDLGNLCYTIAHIREELSFAQGKVFLWTPAAREPEIPARRSLRTQLALTCRMQPDSMVSVAGEAEWNSREVAFDSCWQLKLSGAELLGRRTSGRWVAFPSMFKRNGFRTSSMANWT